MLISDCEISARSFSHIHRLQSEGTVAFLFSGNASALQKLHMSEKQGRQKQQQQRVKRRGGGGQTRRCERANIGANADCYCKHGEGGREVV